MILSILKSSINFGNPLEHFSSHIYKMMQAFTYLKSFITELSSYPSTCSTYEFIVLEITGLHLI